jgi:DNA-binding transcriptional LysR family regulator
MRRVRAGELGTLRVGVFPGPLRLLLPELLAELRRRSPDVDVATRYLSAADQVTAVLERRLDLALMPSLLSSRAPPPLREKVIDRQPLGIAVAARHPLAKKRRLGARELGGLPFVWMARASDPEVYDAILAALTAAGVRPRSLLESSSPESSLSIVAADLGMSVKTKTEVAQARAGGEEVVWKPLAGFELELLTIAAWDPQRVTPQLRSLLSVLDEHLARTPVPVTD